MQATGTLYLVATPIGNSGDITPRAIDILNGASFILCEDTRKSGILLSQLGIKKRLISYHNYNESSRVDDVVAAITNGETVALISDAGTPGISDPGYRVVRACREAGLSVSAAAGPCAAIVALSISGLPTDRFLFEGFLPPKGAKRSKRIDAFLESGCTVVVYESTHKILKLLEELAQKVPERKIFIARELSKTYEETLYGTCSSLYQIVKERGGLKGEIVVVIGG